MYLGSNLVDSFLLAHPKPTSMNVADLLKAFSSTDRGPVAQELIARGVDSTIVAQGLSWLETTSKVKTAWPTIAGVLTLASASASAFHGYRRNQSIPWGLWWFLMGSIFPIVTPVIGLAQGFGKKRS